MVCFLLLTFAFLRKINRGKSTKVDISSAAYLANFTFWFLGLISFSIIYRIIEFSAVFGLEITRQIAQHEVWQYCFNTAYTFLAIIAFYAYHPGKVFQCRDSGFPSGEEKKRAKEFRNSGAPAGDLVDAEK